uniref:Uncharacterized protein n=1 Tax=Anguilla anguilla TaxID=7936 RepID=A0A0E9U5G8_ANGAN
MWLESTGLDTVGGGALSRDINSYRKCVMQKISNGHNNNKEFCNQQN